MVSSSCSSRPKFSEVLKIKNETTHFVAARAKRRNRNSQEALLAVLGLEINFVARQASALGVVLIFAPEAGPQFVEAFAAYFGELVAGDFFSRAIQEHDDALRVCREQAAAHGMNDVFVEGL